MILSGDSLDFFKAFLGGVGISLTPCIYPLIPITAGYIGANAAGSRLKGFFLSLVYVTGVAVTYSILGLLASLTGTFFGRISTNPITYMIVGVIIILFGISMLGLFHIHLPRIIKVHNHEKGNYFSAFFLGLSSGLVASPCLTPVLGSILIYLTTKKNLIYGVTLLFSFAYGMGLVLILAGTFSAILVNFPKTGKWMAYIKIAGAIILIIMGGYFVFNGIKGVMI